MVYRLAEPTKISLRRHYEVLSKQSRLVFAHDAILFATVLNTAVSAKSVESSAAGADILSWRRVLGLCVRGKLDATRLYIARAARPCARPRLNACRKYD